MNHSFNQSIINESFIQSIILSSIPIDLYPPIDLKTPKIGPGSHFGTQRDPPKRPILTPGGLVGGRKHEKHPLQEAFFTIFHHFSKKKPFKTQKRPYIHRKNDSKSKKLIEKSKNKRKINRKSKEINENPSKPSKQSKSLPSYVFSIKIKKPSKSSKTIKKRAFFLSLLGPKIKNHTIPPYTPYYTPKPLLYTL